MEKYPKAPQIFFACDGYREKTYDVVLKALISGYNFFSFYENNCEVEEVVRAVSDFLKTKKEIKRENYFFQGIIAIESIESNGTRLAIAKIQKQFEPLKNIDCLILERPSLNFELTERAWYELKVHKEWGVVNHIGVSNFDKEQIMYLWATTEEKPACNLIEFNMRNQRWDRVSWCKENAIAVQGYGTLHLKNSSKKIIERAAQQKIPLESYIIGLVISCGVTPVIGSSHSDQIVSNIMYYDLEFKQEDIVFFFKLNKFMNKYLESYYNERLVQLKDKLNFQSR